MYYKWRENSVEERERERERREKRKEGSFKLTLPRWYRNLDEDNALFLPVLRIALKEEIKRREAMRHAFDVVNAANREKDLLALQLVSINELHQPRLRCGLSNT